MIIESSSVSGVGARAFVYKIGACSRGEVDKDFGILAVVFLAGLYFMHLGVSQYYSAFGSGLTSIIR